MSVTCTCLGHLNSSILEKIIKKKFSIQIYLFASEEIQSSLTILQFVKPQLAFFSRLYKREHYS